MRVNSKFKISDFRFKIGAIVALAIAVASAVLHAQKIDTKAAAAAIMQADRDFNQSVASRDKKTFLSLISETAVFVGDGPMRGHDEILKGWSPFFDPNGPTLTWEPTSAEVLVGGDVGITIGSWTRRTKAADGKTSEGRGQYVTTWQKQKDGAWKVVYDIGSTAR
jgi:ketosteroid isomerase-like protein